MSRFVCLLQAEWKLHDLVSVLFCFCLSLFAKVKLGHGKFGELVTATAPIRAGEVILFISGEIVDTPNKFTIQLDGTRHILTNNGLWYDPAHHQTKGGKRERVAVWLSFSFFFC